MSTLRIAFIPGLIAGVISVFTSWLWMGVIFHRYQRETPETTDSSRIRHLCSSPSPCCPRPTSRLAHHFRARLHHYMVVAAKVITSGSGVL